MELLLTNRRKGKGCFRLLELEFLTQLMIVQVFPNTQTLRNQCLSSFLGKLVSFSLSMEKNMIFPSMEMYN